MQIISVEAPDLFQTNFSLLLYHVEFEYLLNQDGCIEGSAIFQLLFGQREVGCINPSIALKY